MRDPSALIADDATVPESCSVWGLAQLREGVVLGEDCIVGRGAYVGTGVQVGARTKIQNFAQVYEPAVLEDGVFIGPMVVLTNDTYPRAMRPDGGQVAASDWEATGVTIRTGASVGARTVCVAPVTIGRWALVGAGSVVVEDVPDYALVVGSPARRVGWVGPAGRRLTFEDGHWRCPVTGASFEENEGVLREVGDRD